MTNGVAGWLATPARLLALVAVVAVSGAGCRSGAEATDPPCAVFALDQPTVLTKKGERPFNDGFHKAVARALKDEDLIRFTGIDDLEVKLTAFKIDHPECSCISELNVYAHGYESTLRAGCGNHKGSPHRCNNAPGNQNYYFAGGGIPGDNRASWSDLFRNLNPNSKSPFKMCADGQIRLVGCYVGRCDHAGPFLAQVASLAGVRTLAPAIYVKGRGARTVLADSNVWQFGDPNAAAQPCKKLPRDKIPARRRRAELLPHCFCNGTTYDDLPSCTADCSATLACFTGICSPLRVNETWDELEGNPVLTGSGAAVATAAARFSTAPPANAPTTSVNDWYQSGVSQPTVLREGGTYRMWFTGWNDAEGGKSRIGYATSTDGIDWVVHPDPVLDTGPPGAFDEGDLGGPSVLRDGGLYHMWYAGFSDRDRIGHATSLDGINWTKDPSPVLDVGPQGAWDNRLVSAPSVLKDGNVFMMWYEGRSQDLTDRIGLATSPDGVHWTRAGADPVLSEGDQGAWDEYGVTTPSVVRTDSGYHMFYAGMNADDWDAYEWGGYRRIGYAHSTDGLTWQKGSDNPQLGPSPPFLDHDDVWNSQGVYNPAAIWDANAGVFELFARGASLDGSFAIGLFVTDNPQATAATTTTTTTTTTTLPGVRPPCTFDSECNDDDPCTLDQCVAGTCGSRFADSYEGVSCELARLSSLRSCDPNAARRVGRRVHREARVLQRKLVKLKQAKGGRRRRSLGKQIVSGLAHLERMLNEARRGRKLSGACARYFLQVVGAAHSGMDAIRGADRRRGPPS